MRGLALHLLMGGALAVVPPVPGASLRRPIGVATGDGQILIDGTAVASGVSVFSGDQIATRSAGVFIYLRKSAELVLGRATAMQLTATRAGYSVRLNQGKLAALDGQKAPVLVNASGVTIESKTTNGSYEVAFVGGELRILTRRGITVVTGANRSVEVPAGSLMHAAVIPAPAATALAGKILLVSVIVAAAATGTILGVVESSSGPKCVSASQLSCP